MHNKLLCKEDKMKGTKALTKNELKRCFELIGNFKHAERDRLVIAFTFYSAMRIGEVAQLTWADVIDNNYVTLSEIHFNKSQVKARENQKVLINNKLRLEIKRYLDFYSKHHKIDLNKPLIQTQKNTAFSPNSLCQHVNALYAKCNFKNVTSHTGRKSYITALANKSINIKVIMKLARHKHLSTTQRYIETNEQQLKEANELV